MPKVGQWGQLKFEGGSITKVLQLRQVKLPQTKDHNYLQKNKDNTMITQDTSRYKDTRKCK